MQQTFTYCQRVKIGYRWDRGLKGYIRFLRDATRHIANDLRITSSGLYMVGAGLFWLAIRLIRITLSPVLYPTQPLFLPLIYREDHIWTKLQDLTEPSD